MASLSEPHKLQYHLEREKGRLQLNKNEMRNGFYQTKQTSSGKQEKVLSIMTEEIIGHGTWYDKTASEIVKRERKLGRSIESMRTESGWGSIC